VPKSFWYSAPNVEVGAKVTSRLKAEHGRRQHEREREQRLDGRLSGEAAPGQHTATTMASGKRNTAVPTASLSESASA